MDATARALVAGFPAGSWPIAEPWPWRGPAATAAARGAWRALSELHPQIPPHQFGIVLLIGARRGLGAHSACGAGGPDARVGRDRRRAPAYLGGARQLLLRDRGGRVRLTGLTTELAPVRQILEHAGEPTIANAIAPVLSPSLNMNVQ